MTEKKPYTLSEEEMALAINALASSEEVKIYQQTIIGQKATKMIEEYNKSIEERSKGKKGKPEETDESGLPKA